MKRLNEDDDGLSADPEEGTVAKMESEPAKHDTLTTVTIFNISMVQ